MNVTLTTRIHELIVTALKCSSVEGDITKPEALEAIAALKAQGSNEDANNYCLILSVLGMEEEGDPVAEVERLKDAEECALQGEPKFVSGKQICEHYGAQGEPKPQPRPTSTSARGSASHE